MTCPDCASERESRLRAERALKGSQNACEDNAARITSLVEQLSEEKAARLRAEREREDWKEAARLTRETVTVLADQKAVLRAALATAERERDEARAVLAELLRLYEWRFVLAERENDSRCATDTHFGAETRRLLNQYGTEKKAAWKAARAALSSTSVTTGGKKLGGEGGGT